jgi:hypothetical protein
MTLPKLTLKRNGRRAAACFALVALITLISCAPVLSLHPWYTDKDVVFEPGLLGTWIDPTGDSTTVVFAKLNDKAYEVTLWDPSKKVSTAQSFEAHLVKLGDHLFLDAVQDGIKVEGDDVAVLAVSGHMFGRVAFAGDSLKLSFFDDEWVQKSLKAGTISIRHEDLDSGDIVLTATTQELQKFALDHVNDDNAYTGGIDELHRKK